MRWLTSPVDLPPVMDYTELDRRYGQTTVVRGRHYFQQGRVGALTVSVLDRRLSATVRGSQAKPYHCQVHWKEKSSGYDLTSFCTCPMMSGCKHVVATLLKSLPQLPPEVAASLSAGPVPQIPSPIPQTYESLQTQSWLQELHSSAQPPPEPAWQSVPECLLYLLDLDPASYERRRLRLRPVIVRIGKLGGYSSPRPFSGSLHAPARYVRPEDQEILGEVRAHQQYQVASSGLNGPWGIKMLYALLKTGRLHWREPGTALREGAVRSGRFQWQVLTDGRQQLELSVERALPLPLTPPWYVDMKTGEIGPLETGVPDRLAEILMQAPAVAATEAQTVSAELQTLLGEHAASVPLPAQIQVEQRQNVKPVCCLRLMRETILSDYGQQRESDVARLWFDYDGLRGEFSNPSPELTRVENGTMLRITRDRVFEVKAHRALTSAGLNPAQCVPGDPGALFIPRYGSRWLEFLDFHLPKLRRKHWRIEIDPDFQSRLLEPDAEWTAEISDSGQQWFDLALDITVEGQRQPLLPILVGLLRGEGGWQTAQDVAALKDDAVVYAPLPSGAHLKLPVARLKPILTTLLELFDSRPLTPDGRLRLPRLAANALPELAGAQGGLQFSGGRALLELAEKLRNSRGIVDVPVPAGLQTELRPYQRQGLNWLQFLREHELGGVLADDMGLGKTVQALAHLLLEKESGRADRPSLVVAPTSLMFNWKREAERFTPSLKVLVLQGLQRKADFTRIAQHDLILTTYPLLPRDFEVLSKQEYHLLILDEAQMVKNAKSKAAQFVRGFKARQRLCMTGTPMENHLGELWALLDFLAPGFLGDATAFKRRYRTPIEKHGDALVQRHLSRRVAPFLLRRTKSEVAPELPPRTDIVRSVALEGAQRELYETVRLAMDKKVREEIARRGLARSHITILDALLKLRQICCDPRLLKLDAAKKVTASAKLELLMDLLPEMLDEGRRVLLFSQFTSMLDLIKPALDRKKIAYVELRGDTTDRETPVRRFQNGEVPLFLISLKAGGLGLNLTAADSVIHYDPWWNPAVEQQATDRAHRIGQDKPVFVYKLLTEGTVEEKIVALQARKRDLAAALFQEGGGALNLKPDDLADLFAPLPA